MDALLKVDLYELLQISIDADEKEIKSAYRKKALTCHPDKNPDNPRAGEDHVNNKLGLTQLWNIYVLSGRRG